VRCSAASRPGLRPWMAMTMPRSRRPSRTRSPVVQRVQQGLEEDAVDRRQTGALLGLGVGVGHRRPACEGGPTKRV
jgi:hypothetical protein